MRSVIVKASELTRVQSGAFQFEQFGKILLIGEVRGGAFLDQHPKFISKFDIGILFLFGLLV